MKLENILISLMLFSVVVVVFMGVVGDLTLQYTSMGYPMSIDASQTKIFDQSEGINNQTLKMQELISKKPANALQAIDAFLYGGWSALLTTLDSLSMAGTIIGAAATTLNLPAPIVGFLIVVITLTILFTIIYVLFSVGGGS